MKDMRGVEINVGDVILAINLECLDHGIREVDKTCSSEKGHDIVVSGDGNYFAEDVLVLPDNYLEGLS